MNMFSLKALIDDILLLVRNNNISESEDLSRAQIAAWILAYRQAIIKQKREQENNAIEDSGDNTSLSELTETVGPLKLQNVESHDKNALFRRRTVDKIPEIIDNDVHNLFNVHDEVGEPIQHMSKQRKFFHHYRKYTYRELTYWFENGYIYIDGVDDYNQLKYIYVTGLFSHESDADDDSELDENEIKIPAWMIPQIRESILKNELTFMLQRPSDDDNNSTLDGIKPQPQAVTPNEK